MQFLSPILKPNRAAKLEMSPDHLRAYCHEAVMWYVHHVADDIKELLAESGLEVPLLSPRRHDAGALANALPADARERGAHRASSLYEEQVTCSSCHSNYRPAGATAAPSPSP